MQKWVKLTGLVWNEKLGGNVEVRVYIDSTRIVSVQHCPQDGYDNSSEIMIEVIEKGYPAWVNIAESPEEAIELINAAMQQ